jgi:hypothetical protein
MPNFTPPEILILARSFIQVSEDACVGNDQSDDTFWTRIHLKFDKNIAKANSKHEKVPDFQPLPRGRKLESVKSQWYKRILPATQKFQAIYERNPPPSGYLEDDVKMDLYYKELKQKYKASPDVIKSKSLPKSFDHFMLAYKYLKQHPKFGRVIDNGTLGPRSSVKLKKQRPSDEVVNEPRPLGRDSSKKARGADAIVQQVTKFIAKSNNASANSSSYTIDFMKDMSAKMEEANECMADVANAQLMTLAPTPERKEFFRARSRAINLAESNKLKKLELEQMKLDLELREAREAAAAVQERTPAASLPCLPMPNAFKHHDNGCCYPKCIWATGQGEKGQVDVNTPPDLCECRNELCPDKSLKFHHPCNVNYLQEFGIEDLTHRCYACSKEKVGAV